MDFETARHFCEVIAIMGAVTHIFHSFKHIHRLDKALHVTAVSGAFAHVIHAVI